MTAIKYRIHFTAKDGSEAEISGDEKAIEALESILERARGVKWNAEVETWDQGYYKPSDSSDALAKKGYWLK